jgi:hypothetical protein
MDNPEITEGAVKNGQSREIGNIGYTRRRITKQKDTTICVGHHYTYMMKVISETQRL